MNHYPEMSPAGFKSLFGWLRWACTLDLNTFVNDVKIGTLHVLNQIAESTLGIKHILYSSHASTLKNLFLTQIIGIQGPSAKQVIAPPPRSIQSARQLTSKAQAQSTCKSTRKRRKPQALQYQAATAKRTSVERGCGRGRAKGKINTLMQKRKLDASISKVISRKTLSSGQEAHNMFLSMPRAEWHQRCFLSCRPPYCMGLRGYI